MTDTVTDIHEVEAELTYLVPTGEKPVTVACRPGDPEATRGERTGTYERRSVVVRDGRHMDSEFLLEREGFRLVHHETAVRDFYDDEEVRGIYYPEMERLIRNETGAARVVVFDHTRRAGDEMTREEKRIQAPVTRVHNDYTEWSGPQRVRDILPDEAEALLRHRFQVVQVWRAVRDPVLSWPLAICNARSIDAGDLVAVERRYPDRVGEVYHLAYNRGHRWFYFPAMARDEALVFKCYDSMTDGRARFTAHASFDDPETPAGAPPRESIEIRALVFFAGGA